MNTEFLQESLSEYRRRLEYANTYRFINADGYVSTGQGLLGYNMFAYCNNNPVNAVDYSGQILITTILIVNHIINVANKKKINEELDELEKDGIDFSDDEQSNKLINDTLSKEVEGVHAEYKEDGSLEIFNSYEIKDRYVRQKVTMIYERTGKTSRDYDNLSAEWHWHNIVYPIKKSSTKNALLEFDKDPRLFAVRIPTKILEALGWD